MTVLTKITRNMNYKRFLGLWLIMVMSSVGAWAQTYTDHIVRNFKISTKSSVEVYNKYGKVHIRTWEKDSVKFEVDLRIQTSSYEKLNKLKNQISFDFTNTNYYITAKTTFAKSGGVFSDVVETFVPSNEVSINYIIYIPKTTTLKVDNKFGDVYIDDFQGILSLSLSNGNMKANYLQGNTSIQLISADAVINQIDKGKIEVSYSDLEIKEAGKIDVDSRSSVVNIGNAESLKIFSRRDKYIIDDIQKISGDGDFTTVKILKFGQELNLALKYGGLSVDEIANKFSLINIGSAYTDIDLVFDKTASYNLDITHYTEVRLMYPSNLADLKTQDFDVEQKLKLTYGPVGPNVTAASPKVKIMAEKKCYINIIHR
jgi:hypothetical protein